MVAWFALAVPVLDAPVTQADDMPADTSIAPRSRWGERGPTIGAHRAMVAGLFPQMGPIASFDPVGDGWVSFTYLVNDTWIVQIPRGAEGMRSMTTQLDVLPGLAGEVSARIPEPEHVSHDPLVMAYRMIAGSPFSDVGVERVWPERLGRFLYDLHMVPPEFVGMRARGADAVRRERRAELETVPRSRLPAPGSARA